MEPNTNIQITVKLKVCDCLLQVGMGECGGVVGTALVRLVVVVWNDQEGVPLTITPPLERHRPDAWTGREMGRKGIEPKVIVWIHHGAAGLRW